MDDIEKATNLIRRCARDSEQERLSKKDIKLKMSREQKKTGGPPLRKI